MHHVTIKDAIRNMHKWDIAAFLFFYFLGIGAGAILHTSLKKNTIQATAGFHLISHCFTVVGIYALFSGPLNRLRGYTDNGLRWKRKD